MRSFGKSQRRAYTLIELLVTIAIIGILTTVVFADFSKEKDRNALKSLVHQVQTDLVAQQTRAQSGALLNGADQTNGFAVLLQTSGTPSGCTGAGYLLYGDSNTIGKYDSDATVVCRLFTNNTEVHSLFNADTGSSVGGTVNILFSKPNGSTVFYDGAGAKLAVNTLQITLKNTKLNTCYSFTINANLGTISQRKFESSTGNACK